LLVFLGRQNDWVSDVEPVDRTGVNVPVGYRIIRVGIKNAWRIFEVKPALRVARNRIVGEWRIVLRAGLHAKKQQQHYDRAFQDMIGLRVVSFQEL